MKQKTSKNKPLTIEAPEVQPIYKGGASPAAHKNTQDRNLREDRLS